MLRPLSPARVALVGGIPLVRAGLEQMLLACPELVLVAADLDNASTADLVVIDIDHPSCLGGSSAAVSSYARAGATVVAFSWCTNPLLIEESLDSGAAGFLSKAITAVDLAAAVAEVVGGSRLVVRL